MPKPPLMTAWFKLEKSVGRMSTVSIKFKIGMTCLEKRIELDQLRHSVDALIEEGYIPLHLGEEQAAAALGEALQEKFGYWRAYTVEASYVDREGVLLAWDPDLEEHARRNP